ncbi:MAG: homocysteine S-methyltransferase family protein [bacterium]|nr:homocysteine S-methyltransferase family protein [bacterium]
MDLFGVVVMVLDEPVDVLPNGHLFPLRQHTGPATLPLLGEWTQEGGQLAGSLPRLRDAYSGPVGAYAHLEYNENPKFGSAADESFFTLGQGDYTPERYADAAVGWKEMGAQIIGGCCATTPDYIRAVRAAVKP